MKKRLIAVLIIQVLWFGFVSQQLGAANSYHAPNRGLNQLSCGYSPHIDIVPGSPSPSDPISITASGTWPYICVPVYQAHQMLSNTVRIDAAVVAPPGSLCGAALREWEFTLSVGNLLSGSYQVDLYIADHRYSEIPNLCARTSFVVFNYLPQKIFLPTVSK
jgi:hypothetical protein